MESLMKKVSIVKNTDVPAAVESAHVALDG